MKVTIVNYSHPFSEETKASIIGQTWQGETITEIEEIVVPVSLDYNKDPLCQAEELASVRHDLIRQNVIIVKLPGLADLAVLLYNQLSRGGTVQNFIVLKPVKTLEKTSYVLAYLYSAEGRK